MENWKKDTKKNVNNTRIKMKANQKYNNDNTFKISGYVFKKSFALKSITQFTSQLSNISYFFSGYLK